MSVRGGTPSGDARLVEAYEEMRRRHGCEGCSGAGHEVLRRQGLTAWIEAFRSCVGVVALDPPRPSHSATVEREAAGVGGWGVPVRLYPELTRLVAGLALGRLEEGLC